MNNLKFMRKNYNLTQKELAERIDINQSSISRWESGECIPDIDTLIKLSKFYKTSIDYLLGLSYQEKSNKIELEYETEIPSLKFLTEEKKQAIYLLLELNEINFISAYSFMQGLKMQQN